MQSGWNGLTLFNFPQGKFVSQPSYFDSACLSALTPTMPQAEKSQGDGGLGEEEEGERVAVPPTLEPIVSSVHVPHVDSEDLRLDITQDYLDVQTNRPAGSKQVGCSPRQMTHQSVAFIVKIFSDVSKET